MSAVPAPAPRPKWAEKLRYYVTDDLIDFLGPNGVDDEASDRLEAVVLGWLCNEYGHQIENDQCGIPEHRYCVYCNRRETAIAAEVSR